MPRYPERMHQLERLLHEGHELSLDELCRLLSLSSKRHVRRLLHHLRNAGIPIHHRHEGRTKRFFIPPEQRQSPSHDLAFTEEEMLALAVASEAAQALLAETPLDAPLRQAFEKLLDRLAPTAFTFEIEDQPARWHFGNPVVSLVQPDVFHTLQTAINEGRSVRIDYHTASTGAFSADRKIDPLQLARYRGTWAVVAWCHLRQDLRDFALAGIERVVPCDSSKEIAFFTPPSGFDPATYYQNRFAALDGDKIYTVRLHVQADRAPYFQRKQYHPSQRIAPLATGALEVTFEVAGLDEVRSFVQSWGAGVTVLAPHELATRVGNEALMLAGRYANGVHDAA